MNLRRALRFPSAMLIAAVMVLAGPPAVHAAGASRIPRSALPDVRSLDAIERRGMPPVDVQRLLAEDAVLRQSNVPAPTRYAINHTVALTTDASGTWETLDDGSRLWRLRLSSPGALSLSLGMEQFDLPAGATFWVHAPDGSGVQGPYTAEDRNAFGGLWTAVVLGDEIVAELHSPVESPVDLRISSVSHGYREFGERAGDSFPEKRGSCNINVVCSLGNRFADQIRSVARYTFSDGTGSYLCTGQLINNTSEDDTPYFYTAGHCVETDTEASTVVAYWNYQTATCEEWSGGSLDQNQSGATLIAHSFDSENDFQYDFALLELDEVPDDAFNVFYSGWDRSGVIPDSTVTIHHPAGDQKSISFDNDPPAITTIGGSTSPGDGRHWRIHDWDVGTTEEGSSGACLFDEASGLCIGDLSGGYAACGNNQPDWYARLHSQWTGEGSPETRLSDWLDPLGIGVEYLFGRNLGASAGTTETWLIPSVASTPG
ncbi:MAG: lysyl endopeptidase, partial [Acidobacteria bacterium]|nr:lysyl endopeptidase [Acidobacteriota bacterium]